MSIRHLVRAAALVLLASFLSIPVSVNATPPDVIDIREDTFGHSPTHLFVIRTSRDNMGLYESLRVESFLIAIEVATGNEEVWVLDRMRRDLDYSDDSEPLGPIVRRDEGQDFVNPYAVLEQRGGVPWAAVSIENPAASAGPTIVQNDNTITATDVNGGQYAVTLDNVADHIAGVGAMMAKNIADAPRMSTLTTRSLFEERSVGVENCRATNVLDHWDGKYPAAYRLIRMVCSDFDEDGRTSLLIRAPYVEGSYTQ